MKPALHLVPMCLAVALVLGACASRPTRTVAVEDRSIRPAAPAARPAANGSGSASGSPPAVAAPAPAAESPSNAGRPGYYTVRPGDTLVRIGLDHGQNWRDIARWNQIENPNLIEVGQVLRVAPEPALSRTPPARGEPRTDGRVDPRQEPRVPPRAEAPGREGMRDGGRDGTREVAVDDAARETPREAAADVAWAWPASGAVFQGFDEQRNKGLKIAGKAGDAVTSAADGRVVYAGSALRGYGNLVIIKHNATFLTAYAHNQTLLVKEDQAVRRGQKIAEMGSSDADRVQLHFEIRRDGKPVDPARLLPAR